MLRSRLVHSLGAVAVLVVGWFVFGDRVLAMQDSEDKVWFGPVGVGAGQAARINVYGLGTPITGGIAVPVVPWTFTVRIFDRRGILVQEREFQVAPGVIASFEINVGNPNDFPVDRLGRRTLRAEVVGFNPQPDPPGRYAATLEVYSQLTGHTSVFIGNPNEQPPSGP